MQGRRDLVRHLSASSVLLAALLVSAHDVRWAHTDDALNGATMPALSACDGALWGSPQCSPECVSAAGGSPAQPRRPVVLLVDSTFNDVHGLCGCGMRRGRGPCVPWDAAREAEGTDLRQFDWVVFGLVDRPDFDLRHFLCPFMAPLSDNATMAPGDHAVDGEQRLLEVDAVVVTDRELMYEQDKRALHLLLGSATWLQSADRLSIDGAVTAAWILEPPVISTHAYTHARVQAEAYDLVFSHDRGFLGQLPDAETRARYAPLASSLIHARQRGLHTKSKLVSILASARAHAPGHVLRHELVKRFAGVAVGAAAGGGGARHVLEAFGQAYDGQVVANKADTLVPYMFSFAIENSKFEAYFTEKILDCFLTGVIPIYWGAGTLYQADKCQMHRTREAVSLYWRYYCALSRMTPRTQHAILPARAYIACVVCLTILVISLPS